MAKIDVMPASLLSVCAAVLLAGCGALSHTNIPLEDDRRTSAPPPIGLRPDGQPVRATFKVDGARGNPRVLFFLALSGGGSRAAYLSAATMLRLQSLYEDVDLLGEVDVISTVSGGSLPGAYYAVSRDETLRLVGPMSHLRQTLDAGRVSRKLAVDPASGALRCADRLTADEQEKLRNLPGMPSATARVVAEICEQAALTKLPTWDSAKVRELMKRNYLLRWFGNWFWPDNIFLYWMTAYDRSDIMAKTLEDNLYNARPSFRPLRFRDLNPWRPYLLVNSTNATEQNFDDSLLPEPYSFGSVFTFTDDDFQVRLRSDIQDYEIARAVMASSAFPLVFQNMTLADFRPQFLDRCRKAPVVDEVLCRNLYLHVFDGGNSDNLGLRSIKRTLFDLALSGQLEERYDKVIVLLVDAFTRPIGALRTQSDPRGLLSLIADFNVVDAIDSLLQSNRAKIAGEFKSAELRWQEGDCDSQSQNLPPDLCRGLDAKFGAAGKLDLRRSMVFYHFGFDDVRDRELKNKL
ncbi:MAG TPA: patatin-like phospholipase family protein, partial [Lysobacter sp.]|nr:patatin-like phospholipase family protein [Lysobacter sp.]